METSKQFRGKHRYSTMGGGTRYAGPPGAVSTLGARLQALAAGRDTSTPAQTKDMTRIGCSQCGKMVGTRGDGSLRGHQSSRGISCIGAVPTTGTRGADAPGRNQE